MSRHQTVRGRRRRKKETERDPRGQGGTGEDKTRHPETDEETKGDSRRQKEIKGDTKRQKKKRKN